MNHQQVTPRQLTLADHAELWAQGKIILPKRDTPEWDAMYASYILFAFADFQEAQQNEIH